MKETYLIPWVLTNLDNLDFFIKMGPCHKAIKIAGQDEDGNKFQSLENGIMYTNIRSIVDRNINKSMEVNDFIRLVFSVPGFNDFVLLNVTLIIPNFKNIKSALLLRASTAVSVALVTTTTVPSEIVMNPWNEVQITILELYYCFIIYCF